MMQRLAAIGELRLNESGHMMTETELAAALEGADACIVLSWNGCSRFSKSVLQQAADLKLIVTPGSSVAPFITEAVYERGIKVCSAHRVMSRYVAEGVLAYMLAEKREIVARHASMRRGDWNSASVQTLIGLRIGLVGLGAVGRCLLEFLEPFDVSVTIYDPYVNGSSLHAFRNVRLSNRIEDALQHQDIVSLHASKTEETYHMLNKQRLAMLKDGALLINTARGSLIDEQALLEELQAGRIRAVLDVFEQEPLPSEHPFRSSEQVLLMPHVAGMVELELLTLSMLEELERFRDGLELRYEIAPEQYKLMTR
jgi:phosphoglycerate dehydrogenase-like enzyme